MAAFLAALCFQPLAAEQGILATGNFGSFLLHDDGSVRAWGNNSGGQLGIGSLQHSPFPVGIAAIADDAIWIAAGDNHALAVKSDGSVVAWGGNTYGVLGDGTQTNRSVPVTVGGGLSGIVAASAGKSHSLALDGQGRVFAWGYNSTGQLGDGSTSTRLLPVRAGSLSGMTELSAGGSHSLALDGNGEVWAWGSNQYGQLGNGSGPASKVPVKINTLHDIIEICTAGDHSLALQSDGTAWAWGRNPSGALGTGNRTNSALPIALPLDGIVRIAAGWNRSMALDDEGVIWSWGARNFGVYGAGSYTESLAPVAESTAGETVDELSAGLQHSLALATGGDVLAWGDDAFGQLGSGLRRSRNLAEQVSGIGNIIDLDAGENFGVAVRSDGSVLAWGANTKGTLGEGFAGGDDFYPALVDGIGGVKSCSAGIGHALVAKSDGTAWTWGSNASGQLGDGSLSGRASPVQVSGLTAVKSVAGGLGFSLALLEDGTVRAWGDNSLGQLGDGSGDSSPLPVTVSGLNDVKEIHAGSDHALALKNDGTVWAWGDDSLGQLGTGGLPGSLPRQVSSLSGVISLATGINHSLALHGDGSVSSWGDSSGGKLGRTASGGSLSAKIPGLAGIRAVGAGENHSFAIGSGGSLQAWGVNYDGQLGDGSYANKAAPVSVPGAEGLRRVCGALGASFALKEDGKVLSWGSSNRGELADGYGPRLAPGIVFGVNSHWPTPDYSLSAFDGKSIPLGSSIQIGGVFQSTGAALEKVSFYSRGIFLAEDETDPFSWTYTPETWGDIEVNAVAVDANGSHSLAGSIVLHTPYDSDEDALPDDWEILQWGNLQNDADSDPDIDALSNLTEYQEGSDPKDFYNGVSRNLVLIGGNAQYAEVGAFSAEPLVFEVRRNGIPLANAPVWLEVTLSSPWLLSLVNDGSGLSTSIETRTGPDGRGQVYMKHGSLGAFNYLSIWASHFGIRRSGQTASATTQVRNIFPLGTLGRDATDAIDNRISGKDPLVAKPVYFTKDHGNAIYARNTNCWAHGLASQMSCISPWNSAGGDLRAGVAITRRHVLNAAHFPLNVGDTIRFVTASNAVVTRTIVSRVIHPNYVPVGVYLDFAVYTLNADLPPEIVPCKILPASFADKLGPLGVWSVPALALDQEEKALAMNWGGFVTQPNPSGGLRTWASFTKPTLPVFRAAFFEDVVVGDSGNPAFLVVNDSLVLVTVWGGGSIGTFVNPSIVDLNAMILAADLQAGTNTNLQVEVVDLSAYLPFSP
ncbi:RCC1 domain-containing protein [Luteolibacter luteus]|uniref:RCC1-like domain-containing protein n=1 Tax=Luteolibacter luteus TaxID=2728835 RepID=A0A858RCN6_9BACT|nr:RCC1 domain-containing protein [Luteolibacter luteus]QJE94557.1 hypothetical protein HHL09_01745 [Luteolibacter luteus]